VRVLIQKISNGKRERFNPNDGHQVRASVRIFAPHPLAFCECRFPIPQVDVRVLPVCSSTFDALLLCLSVQDHVPSTQSPSENRLLNIFPSRSKKLPDFVPIEFLPRSEEVGISLRLCLPYLHRKPHSKLPRLLPIYRRRGQSARFAEIGQREASLLAYFANFPFHLLLLQFLGFALEENGIQRTCKGKCSEERRYSTYGLTKVCSGTTATETGEKVLRKAAEKTEERLQEL
jgi:hypothetical protein